MQLVQYKRTNSLCVIDLVKLFYIIMNKNYKIEIPNNEIINKIENSIFSNSIGLLEIYNELLNYFELIHQEDLSKEKALTKLNFQEVVKQTMHEDLIKIKNKKLKTIAIDLPILLKLDGSNYKDTIIIVAMDPLSPLEQNKEDSDNIGFWVPFSLIDNIKTGEKSFKSNYMFFVELLKNYNIYVTDIYKLFYRLEEPVNKKSNSDIDYIELENTLHYSILNTEIKSIRPKAIVTLGNNSRDTILKKLNIKPEKWDDIQLNYWMMESNINPTPIISIPHISGAANGTSSKILNKYPEISGTKNEKLAKLVHHKLMSIKQP